MKIKQEQENEIKYLIGKDDYDKLMSKYSLQPKLQTNYYFDTVDDKYYGQKTTIRIREKKNKCELTVKRKSRSENDLTEALEQTIKISQKMFENFIKNGIPEKFLSNIGIVESLVYLGKLETYRSKLSLNDGLVLDVDMNFYNGIADYEIEVEIENKENVEVVDKFILGNDIKINESNSKYDRFRSL